MNNTYKIFPFTHAFALFWLEYFPYLRFYQVVNLLQEYGDGDPFYWKEEKWLEAMEKIKNERSKNNGN